MNKKTAIYFMVIILGIALLSIQTVYLNKNSLAPTTIEYKIGEEVEIKNDFFDTSKENMDGYSIKVIDTQLLSINDYERKYGDINNDFKASYIYIIKANFKNCGNSNGGINLAQYTLQNNAYISLINREVFPKLNDFDSLTFALRLKTDKDIYIPFGINTDYIDINKLENSDSTLVVSLYPNKKVISLN